MAKVKKLLFISHSSELLGGAEDEFGKLLKYFRRFKDDYDVDGMFPDGSRAAEFAEYCSRFQTYERCFFPASRRPLKEYLGYIKSFFNQRRILKSFIKGQKYDLCILNTSVMPWFAGLLSKQQYKMLILVRESVKPDFIRKTLYRYYSRKAEYLIFANERNKNEYLKLTGKENAVTLYYSLGEIKPVIDTNAVTRKLQNELDNILADSGVFKLMISGTVYEVKNQIMAVRVLAEMKKKNYKLPVVIIKGDSKGNEVYLKKMKKLISQNGLDGNFFFVGYVSKDVYYKLFEKIDVLLITSVIEGTPLVLFEAMMMGKPVISTKVGGAEDLIQNGINGFIVNGENEMAEKISLLQGDSILRTKFQNNLMKLYESEFTYDKVYGKYRGIVNKLTGD